MIKTWGRVYDDVYSEPSLDTVCPIHSVYATEAAKVTTATKIITIRWYGKVLCVVPPAVVTTAACDTETTAANIIVNSSSTDEASSSLLLYGFVQFAFIILVAHETDLLHVYIMLKTKHSRVHEGRRA